MINHFYLSKNYSGKTSFVIEFFSSPMLHSELKIRLNSYIKDSNESSFYLRVDYINHNKQFNVTKETDIDELTNQVMKFFDEIDNIPSKYELSNSIGFPYSNKPGFNVEYPIDKMMKL